MTFSRVLSGDPYNSFFHGLCTTSLDFAVGSPLMFSFWCFFMVPGILFQEELWTLFSSCLQYLLEWCGVILLASLCLREAKMWMVTPVGAFLESFQLKIRMKVFRRWWRITEKSGGFFLFFLVAKDGSEYIDHPFCKLSLFFLLYTCPQLQLICPPFSLFRLLTSTLDLYLMTWYFTIYYSHIASTYLLRFTTTSANLS